MRFIALLRGINVGGNKKVPMAELRAISEKLGFKNIHTYIQSGNLVFETQGGGPEIAAKLETAIPKHFGFSVDVIVRSEKQWSRYLSTCPFEDAVQVRANLVLLGLAKGPLAKDLVSTLKAKAAAKERIQVIGDALWIDFGNGVGRSKLTPQVLDRAAGSSVTMRNWRTVTKLGEMLSSQAKPS